MEHHNGDIQPILHELGLLFATLDVLPAHIAILDETGSIRAVNAAWRDFGAVNGLQLHDDGVGRNYLRACKNAISAGDPYAVAIVQGMRQVLGGERDSFAFDYPCHAPIEQRWFAFRISRLTSEGDPLFLVSHENVTARRLAEETARISEARYQAVFRGVGDAILVADESGRVLDANPAAETLLGFRRDVLLTQSVSDLVTRDHDWTSEEYATLRAAGAWRDKLELRHRDGHLIPVEALVTVMPMPDGIIYLAAVRDMTRHRAVEVAKEELVDTVAHDLGGPLMVIRGQGQLLRRRLNRGDLDEKRLDAALAAIDAAVERASRLISDLTDVAWLEAQRPLDLNRSSIDLASLIAAIVASLEGTRSTVELRLMRNIAGVIGCWDVDRLTRVFENLLANAIKYSPPSGVVTVDVSREDSATMSHGLVTVTDQGVGIPSDDLPFIFEPFHRGRNVQGRITGTSLGLWGSQRVVALHDGTIDIASVEGQGTTVTVRLPLSPCSA